MARTTLLALLPALILAGCNGGNNGGGMPNEQPDFATTMNPTGGDMSMPANNGTGDMSMPVNGGGDGGAGCMAGSCGTCPDSQTCAMCCYASHPTEAKKVQQYVIADCACATGALCNAACAASACKGMQPDQACASCLNGLQSNPNQACITMASNQCVGDPMCQLILLCFGSCPMM